MAFKLLDIPKFIQQTKARAVTNGRSFNQNLVASEDGFQSKSIFGVSTNDKFNLWGYINLEDVVMHPLIYDNVSFISPVFNRARIKSKKYKIVNGMLEEDENGGTGIGWLISNWKKINFDKYRTEKNKLFVDFIKNTNENLLFINKVPVIPIAYREAKIDGFRPEDSDIDNLYKKILSVSKAGRSEYTSQYMETMKDKTGKDFMQNSVNNLYKHFIDHLEGKHGFVRGPMTAKRLDNVSRMVANANPDIPINSCVIPWHILLNMFDIFVVAYLSDEKDPEMEELRKKLQVDGKSSQEFGELFDYIYRDTAIYDSNHPTHKSLWIELLTRIFNENPLMRVIVKRDPGWNANSMHCLRPLIGTDNMYHIMVPSWIYDPLGGDSFNTNFMIDTLDSNIIYEDDEYKITAKVDKARIIRTMNTIWKNTEANNV